jgi:predicted metalloprotease
MELQVDCFAGVWGHDTQQRKVLEQGDIEEGLNAAASVGDDRIQQKRGGRVNQESFKHGSAAQRASWFKKGFDSGDPRSCDTFSS